MSRALANLGFSFEQVTDAQRFQLVSESKLTEFYDILEDIAGLGGSRVVCDGRHRPLRTGRGRGPCALFRWGLDRATRPE